jgi:hypothetical protein
MKKSNFLKFVLSFLAALALSSFIGVISAAMHPSLNPFAVTACLMVLPLAFRILQKLDVIQTSVHELSGAKLNAIQQEFWVNYIIDNLFKDNSFLTKCFDESDYVLEGSVVHIPQAGAKPTVVKNRSSFPGTAVRRTDTDITYTLDVYSTDPTLITNAETKEISYDKIGSAIGEHVSSLEETYADDMLVKWAPTVTGNILRTTGSTVATSLSTGASGTRKAFVKEDLKRAQYVMNKQKISKEGRYALVPSDLYSELMNDADLMKRDGANGGEMDIKNGVMLKLYGFSIMERSESVVYTNATPPAPKAYSAATAVTDNQAIICWQKDCVAKAKGAVKFFENVNDALYYGDVYSAEVKLGGRKRRTNGDGVVAIVQDLVS